MDNISSMLREGGNFTSEYGNTTVQSDCVYGVSGIYGLSLVDLMLEILNGNCTVPSRINFNGEEDDYNSVICKPWYLKGLINKCNASFESINLSMGSIATAITSEMRKQGSTFMVSVPYSGGMYATATVIRTTSCI
jgi:hypothetical protein